MNIGDNLFQIMRLTQTTGTKSNVVPNTVPEKTPATETSNNPKSFFAQEAATAHFSPQALAKSKESNQNKSEENLTDAEKEEVETLKERDTEVRQHEQAHLAAAGQYAKGGAQYEFETGPDNAQYAVGGEVNIDTSPISGDPSATITKVQVLKGAASAPAEPRAQDNSVATDATKMEGNTEQVNANTNTPNKQKSAQRNAQQNAASQYSQSYQAFSPAHTNYSRPTFSMSA